MSLCFRISGIVQGSERASNKCSVNKEKYLHWHWNPLETVHYSWSITGYSWCFYFISIEIRPLILLMHEVILRTRTGIETKFSVKWQNIAKFYVHVIQPSWKEIIPKMKVGVEKRQQNKSKKIRVWATFSTTLEELSTHLDLEKVLRKPIKQICSYGLKNSFKEILE